MSLTAGMFFVIAPVLLGFQSCELWKSATFNSLTINTSTEGDVRAKYGPPRYAGNVDAEDRILEYPISVPIAGKLTFTISRSSKRLSLVMIETTSGGKEIRQRILSFLGQPHMISRFRRVDAPDHPGESMLVRIRRGDRWPSTSSEEIEVLEFWRVGVVVREDPDRTFAVLYLHEPLDASNAPCFRVDAGARRRAK